MMPMHSSTSPRFSIYCLTAIVLLAGACHAIAVHKPTGIFSSSGASNSNIYQNPELRGVLIRTSWSKIEPRPGEFDFSHLDAQVAKAREQEVQWALAVAGGATASPAWIIDTLEADYLEISFRGKSGYRLPLYWDPVAQARLALLAHELAERYQDDEQLALVYVTQMTSNGIEGHLNGVDMSAMRQVGYTDDKWVNASIKAARSFAEAFENKAVAIELHELNHSAAVPTRIMNELWADPSLEERVGVGLWWLSGKTHYQAGLIDALAAFPGDIYAQVIGRSDQARRFEAGDYKRVFDQAKQLDIRYIEAWEYEFRSSGRSAQGAWNAAFEDFNHWADAHYREEPSNAIAPCCVPSSKLSTKKSDQPSTAELITDKIARAQVEN
ncbi:MAG TPA: hypothetical protein DEA90_00635 [Opitutae bacterium]|nr:hypothetical protein [Opitutae bacterium]